MAYHKPIPNRKVPSSFISDATEKGLKQLSPVRRPHQIEQVDNNNNNNNSSNLNTTNQVSRTNFIGNSIFPSERSRAFAITKTGERLPVVTDENFVPKTSSNPFAIKSPRLSVPTMERISEKSSSVLSVAAKSSRKRCTKKPLRRYKYRLLCSPRKMKTTSSSRLLMPDAQNDKRNKKEHRNASIETQTEHISTLACGLDNFRAPTGLNKKFIPNEIARIRHEQAKAMQQRFYTAAAIPPPMEPLKIYTKNNYNLSNYSELRSLASALTLITLVALLFSTFFDVECLWNCLNSWWQCFCNWLLPQERPKTKIEIFITFLQDMWS